MTDEPLEVAIAKALFDRLKSAPSPLSAVPRAAPLVDYTPATGVTYLDVRPLMRAEPARFGVAESGSDFCRGVFQVDVVAPSGAGESPATRVAALVQDRFPKGKYLTVNGRWLEITATPAIAAAVKDAPPWVRYPVSIRYQVIT